ncbi:MAG TPA: NAD(P)H-dependent glycerol-3-phosphate dehydrogenase [Phycisphaerae bacterium]|nr:NAD(P)H-dependent glycerol-3-phosphate dehydrogenase [Phycisphaerae bacterium]
MGARIHQATVIGDGAMGTVCAIILAENGANVRLWSNFPEQAEEMARNRENARFLPGRKFPDNLQVTADPAEALGGAELIVSAVPCQFIRGVWGRLASHYHGEVPIVAVSKGIEISTVMVSTEILTDVLGSAPLAALSGPSIAPELADRQPCAVVAAAESLPRAELIQHAFSNAYFRVYVHTDLIGVEIAGATKNVIALAAGIIDGIQAGCNAKAALLTRGIVEICRLGTALGANAATFQGLAGVGDLVTTCISPVGRNRTAGERIGRGMSADEAVAATNSVIEGIPTTRAVLDLARRHGVVMPITEAVASVLSGAVSPREAITRLMTRELRHEQDDPASC